MYYATFFLPFLKRTIVRDRLELFKALRYDSDFARLDFKTWKLPEMTDKQSMTLRVELPKSKTPPVYVNGVRTLYLDGEKNVPLKIRIVMDQKPTDVTGLKFLVYLVPTGSGKEDSKKLLVSKDIAPGTKNYRDLTLKFDSTLEEGTYYLRVVAENNTGVQLNTEDNFRVDDINHKWQIEKIRENGDSYDTFKAENNAKTINETAEDIFLTSIRSEDDTLGQEETEANHNPKLNNAIQGYFEYRADLLKSKQPVGFPVVDTNVSCWKTPLKKQQTSIDNELQRQYILKFNDFDRRWDIPISKKLYDLERMFLVQTQMGYVHCQISSDSRQNNFNFDFRPFDHAEFRTLQGLRKKIFASISESATDEDGKTNGVFETWLKWLDVADPENANQTRAKQLKDYVKEYASCYDRIRKMIIEGNNDKVFESLFKLQNLDTITLNIPLSKKTPTERQEYVEVILVPPLHPLRLAWFSGLFDLFNELEKSLQKSNNRASKLNQLKWIFEGHLSPTNNPLLIARNSMEYLQYAGEIAFGWGIYIQTGKQGLFNERQIKALVAEQLNLDFENRIDTDVDS
ncbi:MAG: hypothetical protein PHQ75_04695, partial [Thermoguttaceae bacterium]|nr:hypothetical protein [Thermoguttaceae bacterium]